MNIEDLRDFCLSLNGATESFPFGESTLVFKVLGKIFCLMDLEGEFSVNLKNDPEKIVQMREEFPAVSPGYHMNKKHWNTVFIDGSIPSELIREWIVESYEQVLKGLPVSKKNELRAN